MDLQIVIKGYNMDATNPFGSVQTNTMPQFTYFMAPGGGNNTIPNKASSTTPLYTTTSPYVTSMYAPNVPLTQIEVLAQQVKNLQKQMVSM